MSLLAKVGTGSFLYEEIRMWGRLPEGWVLGEVPGVAVDSADKVYALTRGEHPVVVFDREGNFLQSWGEGLFVRAHAIFIDPGNFVYCVDDLGQAVRKFTPDGKPLMSIETLDHPADTGYVPGSSETVKQAGGPFNLPTGVALSSDGALYVSDGYGNARIHKFSSDGRLLFSWGQPGSEPGHFITPHGVFIDDAGLIYISDRMNARVQIFDPRGKFVTQWCDVCAPDNICGDSAGNLYIAELGFTFLTGPTPLLDKPPARVTVRDIHGRILAVWGEKDPYGSGMYFSPHGIAGDSRGDLYVGEVPASYTSGAAPKNWPVLRKYIRSR
jgi:hypothetical protein